MLLQTWKSVDNVVQKEIMNPGSFSKKPTECATCEVIIEDIDVINASVQDLKTKFNSEILNGIDRKTLIIGEANCEIDRQIERAIKMMMVSEKSLVTISIFLKEIDDHLVIKFEISLIEVQPFKPIWEWTPENKYLTALKYKETGVSLFKENRFVDGFYRFSKACKILITLEPIPDLELDTKLESKINNLRLVLYNNMAGCQLNCKNYEHTISLCTKVLNKEGNNVKALYRRGMAHGNLRDLDNAVADLKNATNLEPHNQIIKEQFLIYNKKWQEANKRFEEMVKRMFKT
ncbi:Peptidyl-prolyl cis-trans isomerase FKBP62 [Eufriesea mexicana]|uniref:Peptidyl-prolyl cis-trans isomerase FKBP62 n=1 Tax=Eufriesea mexicana TaxID=516756 RepID=A0A310S7N3_9HYME|nr:PREDICTED: peptidyl-prolyl cis-trans isomerase FKBP62-like [Eufriesea mexicana]OAD53942.1 Peptidyl-prolyl cis-trans isomerase FKBP62 [Eufriesea mexicana]